IGIEQHGEVADDLIDHRRSRFTARHSIEHPTRAEDDFGIGLFAPPVQKPFLDLLKADAVTQLYFVESLSQHHHVSVRFDETRTDEASVQVDDLGHLASDSEHCLAVADSENTARVYGYGCARGGVCVPGENSGVCGCWGNDSLRGGSGCWGPRSMATAAYVGASACPVKAVAFVNAVVMIPFVAVQCAGRPGGLSK